MKNQVMALVSAGILLAGCNTYTAQQYQSSPENTIALRDIAATGKRASVGKVTTASSVVTRPTCGLAGSIDIGGELDITAAIKQAFQAEFLAGDIYSSRGTPINVVVTEMKPEHYSISGKWTIGLSVSSSKGQGYNVGTVYNFGTSFSLRHVACNNTADAFNRALAKAINNMVKNPKFRSLL